MIVFPNAKINIGLNITNRRPDGYHDIVTLMMPVGWHDILEIVPAKGMETTLTTTGRRVDCQMQSNLVIKAYNALKAKVDLPPVDIYLRKIIPDGAGLGGGSADAAFMLTALNAMFALGFSKAELAETAATIGADCPVFIYNEPMLATGTGTTLTPFNVPQLAGKSIVIAKPDIHISTAKAYAGVTPRKPQQPLSELLSMPLEQWRVRIKNDFEESISREFPGIETLKTLLYDGGAVYAAMSGSGSAVYGIFDDDKLAEQTAGQLSGYNATWHGQL